MTLRDRYPDSDILAQRGQFIPDRDTFALVIALQVGNVHLPLLLLTG